VVVVTIGGAGVVVTCSVDVVTLLYGAGPQPARAAVPANNVTPNAKLKGEVRVFIV
jgi:hypothetical protein